MTQLLIFDGNDTLWHVQSICNDIRSEARHLVAVAGLDPNQWEQAQRSIENDIVLNAPGTTMVFASSCVDALDQMTGTRAPSWLRDEMWHLGCELYQRPVHNVALADHILRELSDTYTLALIADGDLAIEETWINRSGLASRFASITVVPTGTEKPFAQVARLSSDGIMDKCWVISDALNADILPATQAGLRGIWIDEAFASPNTHRDSALPERVSRVTHLAGVPGVLAEFQRSTQRHASAALSRDSL
jgi:FMN phosphatase YigB (HAD superfamily)